MRCLLCGNPLSVLQKLTDNDFCSAEHRNSFVDEQQRLILERLSHSAARIQQVRAAAATAPKAVPQAEESALPQAPFMTEAPQLASCTTVLPGFGPLPSEVPFHPPLLTCRGPASPAGPKLFPDLPWPRYNAGLWSFDAFEPEHSSEHLESIARILAAWRPLAVFVRAADLVLSRRPEVYPPPATARQGAAVWDWPKDVQPTDIAAIRMPDRDCTLRIRRSEKLYLARPRLRLLQVAAIQGVAAPTEPAAAPRTVPALPVLLRGHGVAFLDRVFRIRPRGAVSDVTTTIPRYIRVDALGVPLAPSLGCNQQPPSGYVPSFGRLLRVRARAPLNRGAIRRFGPIPTSPDAVNVEPSVPHIAATAQATLPQRIEHPLASNPCGGVADASIAGLSAEGVVAQYFVASPAMPHPDLADCVPMPVSRFFRARPRGPVTCAAVAQVQGVVLCVAEPPKCGAALPGLGVRTCQPLVGTRFFRPRPRGPVGCDALPEFESIASAEIAAEAAPFVPVRAVGGLLSGLPRAERMYRFRLRPASDARLQDLATSPVDFTEESPKAPKAIVPAIGVPDCAPALARRFFRMRVSGPLQAAKLAPHELIPAAEAPFLSQWSVPPAPVIAPDLAPVAAARAFRMRLRAGVPDPWISSFAAVSLEAEPLACQPTSPRLGIEACEPAAAVRLFRPRPRGPVDAGARFETLPPEGAPFLAGAVVPLHTAAAAELAPLAMERVFRMRPRGGVADPKLCNWVRLAPALEFQSMFPATPELSLEECLPKRMVRFFRPRPVLAAGADYHLAAVWIPAEAAPPSPVPVFPYVRPAATDLIISPAFLVSAFDPRGDGTSAAAYESLPVSSVALLLVPVAMHQRLAEGRLRLVARLFRARPRPGVRSGAAAEAISAPDVAFAGAIAHATFGPESLGLLSPDFLNRLFRVRPKTALDDAETTLRSIRCKHLPTSEHDPVRATMPPESLATKGPSPSDRLYRMRPRTGRDMEQRPRQIPAEPLAAPKVAAASGAPESQLELLRSVARQMPLDVRVLC